MTQQYILKNNISETNDIEKSFQISVSSMYSTFIQNLGFPIWNLKVCLIYNLLNMNYTTEVFVSRWLWKV